VRNERVQRTADLPGAARQVDRAEAEGVVEQLHRMSAQRAVADRERAGPGDEGVRRGAKRGWG
jgi:hypothetical protein